MRFKESKGIRNPEILIKFVVGRCRNTAERVLAEKWTIKPFRRDYRNEQSVLSQLLYNKVLQIGEKGFELVPCWKSYRDFILDDGSNYATTYPSAETEEGENNSPKIGF